MQIRLWSRVCGAGPGSVTGTDRRNRTAGGAFVLKRFPARWLAAMLLVGLPVAGTAAETELITNETPWRAHLVIGPSMRLEDGQLVLQRRRGRVELDPAAADLAQLQLDRGRAFTPFPPADWAGADFDDHHWPRYQPDELFDYLGDYGVKVEGEQWLTRLSLRTRFGIANPAQVRDLRVTVTAIGGVVVYVNGVEVGRGAMPAGAIHPSTPAQPYPRQAYVTDEDRPLPRVGATDKPDRQWLSGYEARIRTFSFDVPARVLRQGGNVLAVDLRRAPAAGPMGGETWNHLGFHTVSLTSRSGAGVIAYETAVQGTRVWSADAEQQVRESPATESLIRRGWHWTLTWDRGKPVKGTAMGNPFDPVRPIRMAIPRNGTGSGQVVLSDPAGLTGVSARLAGPLRGAGGATIPEAAVDIRFAVQRPGLHYANALMPQPPESARTVPVWLLVNVPATQPPGWYDGSVALRANGRESAAPLRVLVTGLVLPAPRDFQHTRIGLPQCAKSVALHYKVEPWSEQHWQLLESSLKLLGQVGNDVLDAPVILSNFPAAGRPGRPPSRSSDPLTWHQPLVRWVKTAGGLTPDFSVLERYLELYEKHCGPPRALSLGIWEPGSATEVARAYERGVRIDSDEVRPGAAVLVEVWDPKTGKSTPHEVPYVLEKGAEQFWRPLFDGVRDIVRKRGWSERVITLSLGSDIRPGSQTGERVRQWAPYARWDLLSHFSGDPPAQDGRLIATGGLEIGVKRFPWLRHNGVLAAADLERQLNESLEFVQLPTARWHHQPYSPPLVFRTIPMMWGRWGHLGLDFWMPRGQGPSVHSFFSHMVALAAPGPDGAAPTVQFQMLREGVQDFEIRMSIVRGYLRLPEDKREPYRQLLDELGQRIGSGAYLSQHELAYDWPAYVARVQLAAAELAAQSGSAR
jgi:hypothetical protein